MHTPTCTGTSQPLGCGSCLQYSKRNLTGAGSFAGWQTHLETAVPF